MGAIGFPPTAEGSARYKERSLDDLLGGVRSALDDLGWEWHRDGKTRFVANFPFQFFVSNGEKVTIDVDRDGSIDVRSETTFLLAWIDWLGANQKHVDDFLRALADFLGPSRRRRRDEEEDDEPRPRSKRDRLSDD
jgi:hypothetical protein